MLKNNIRHTRRSLGFFLLLVSFVGAAPLAFGEATQLKVLVRSEDAKFIGSNVGGMNVVVKDAQTGELLANGEVAGGTGDTEALMKTGQTRGRSPAGADTASFLARLDLERPRRIEVSVTGPLDVADSIQRVTSTLWMVPGKDKVDPGLVLNMSGLIMDLVDVSREGRTLSLTVTTTMMCGCPITEDGLWKAEDFEAVAQLYRDGELVTEKALPFTGDPNTFAGELEASEKGDYRLTIYGYQESTGNTGVYERRLSLP